MAIFDISGIKQMQYTIHTMDGRQVFVSRPRNISGKIAIPLEGLDRAGKGAVYVVFRVESGGFTERVVVE